MRKVVFLIRSLNIGGAERQLLALIKSIDKLRISPTVVTFYADGTLLSEFVSEGIHVLSANKSGRWDVFPFLRRLIKIIRQEKPVVIVSYLVAANLLAVMLKPVFKPAQTIVSIRHSYLRKEDYDWLAALMYDFENWIAGWSDRIILNSYTGAINAMKRGIPEKKIVVIPNGIDTNTFHPDYSFRQKKREYLGYMPENIVIGLIGRLDPVKDHTGFIAAASNVYAEYPESRFLIIGDGPKDYQGKIFQEIREWNLENVIKIIPAEANPVTIYNALDICVSASIGEGFSNVIAEAMSCEIPCVVTDVGDSVKIVSRTGLSVPARNSVQMAGAIIDMIRKPHSERKKLGELARERIISEFSVEKMVNTTVDEIEKLG